MVRDQRHVDLMRVNKALQDREQFPQDETRSLRVPPKPSAHERQREQWFGSTMKWSDWHRQRIASRLQKLQCPCGKPGDILVSVTPDMGQPRPRSSGQPARQRLRTTSRLEGNPLSWPKVIVPKPNVEWGRLDVAGQQPGIARKFAKIAVDDEDVAGHGSGSSVLRRESCRRSPT